MKLLLCEDCRALTPPGRHGRPPNACACGRHLAWADVNGNLFIYDAGARGVPAEPRAFAVAISNHVLYADEPATSADTVDRALALPVPADWIGGLFAKARSPVVKTRPGTVANVQWADRLPSKIETTVYYVRNDSQ